MFVDLDMSAAHTRIARFMLADSQSDLERALKDIQFWDSQMDHLESFLKERQVDLPRKNFKKILKVALYTSLNGGNPLSVDRLVSNLSINAEEYINKNGISTFDDLISSSLYKAMTEVIQSFRIVEEVKQINTTCYVKQQIFNEKHLVTYTIDRQIPYEVDSAYKGISRVLQGFEIV